MHFQLTVLRQLDSLSEGVYDPTEEQLASVPASVSLGHLLEGHCFVPGFAFLGFRQDGVDDVEEVTSDGAQAFGSALGELHEVVHVHVGVGDGFGRGTIGRRGSLFGLVRQASGLTNRGISSYVVGLWFRELAIGR
jgi:hypothetical protein